MGISNTRDVVRPALVEVDRMLVNLRARGESTLANELTMYRDLAVRLVSRHIETQSRITNRYDWMRTEAANE